MGGRNGSRSVSKILVLGIGGVGEYLTKRLTQDGYHVTVIENDPVQIQHADAEIDARLIRGDATSFVPWHEAEASKMDALIAVTNDDAVNIAATQIGAKLGIKHTIARVRTMEIWSKRAILTPKDLGIELVIRPEELAAREISRLLKSTAGNVIIDVGADTGLQVVAATISRSSPFVGKSLIEVAKEFDDFPFRVACATRDIETLIPGGTFVVQPDDHLYIIAAESDIPRLTELGELNEERRDNMLIIGGGLVAERVAELLQRRFHIKLLEKNAERAEELSHKLRGTEVLHGDGSSRETLLQAGLLEMDTIIAATETSETNIMSAVLAKHLLQTRGDQLHARIGKTIALVTKEEYLALASAMGTDVVIDEKILAANEILRYIRAGEVLSVAHLHGCDADVVELIAAENSPITRKPLHSLKELPGRITIGAVLTNDKWEIAMGVTQIKSGDRVVCVCREDDLGALQRMFLA